MEAGKPSYTALAMGRLRAVHQVLDERPLVFTDPVALPIMGADARDEILDARDHYRRPNMLGARGYAVVRARFGEDRLRRAVARGVRQVVLLGAGLDTWPYRQQEHAPGTRVFEVDHPATQEWKLSRLAAAAIDLPTGVTHVAVDFERGDVVSCLLDGGFDHEQPAVCLWMGVSYYLEPAQVSALLGTLAGLAIGSELILDFMLPLELMDATGRAQHQSFANVAIREAEPLRARYTPAAFETELRDCGFTRVEHTDSATLRATYLAGRTDGLRVDGTTGLVTAAIDG